MTWPTGSVPTTNVDAGTDSPASARADLLDLITKANQMIGETPQPAGRLIGVRVFTSGTYTYTPTAGTNCVVVKCQAAGGGGGSAYPSDNNGITCGGGGGGGYAESRLTSGFSGVTVTVPYSAAGGNLGGNGADGGNASFGAAVVATGGKGGAGRSGPGVNGIQISSLPGDGGAGTAGDIKISGAGGGWGIQQNAVGGYGGAGGSSFMGGGPAGVLLYGNGNTNGRSAGSYGAGGGGGVSATNFSGNGGLGGAGLVIVYEYS